MSESGKNFSQRKLRIGDGLVAERSGIESNQPGVNDPYINFDPETDRWKFSNDGINEQDIGSGAGSGSKNYIESQISGVESSIDGWETDDGLGGVSGSLTLALTVDPLEVLAGEGSLKISKASADADGHFVKVKTLPIDRADRGRVLYGSFEFAAISGYVGSDLIIELYDVTNSAVLYSGVASDLELLNVSGKVQWNVQTDSTTEQIEVRLKVTNTNTNAFDVVIDDIQLGPAAKILAQPTNTVTTNILSSDIITGGAIADLAFTGLAIGKWYEATGNFILRTDFGAGNGAAQVLAKHNGQTINQTLFSIFENLDTDLDTLSIPVSFKFQAQATSLEFEGVSLAASSPVLGNGTLSETYIQLERRFDLDAPSVVTLNELSNRGAFFQAANTSIGTHTASGSFQNFPFQLVVEDTHGAYNAATGEYPCPANGFVRIGTSVGFAASGSGSRIIRIARNGVAARNLAQYPGNAGANDLDTYSAILKVNKGDLLSIQGFQNSGGNLNHSSGTLFFEVKYINDLTTLGVVKNFEVIEERNIVQNTLGTALNTWYELDPGWFIDVPEGTFRISGETLLRHYTSDPSDTAFCSLVLSTAADAASFTNASIVAGTRGSSFSSVNEPGRYMKYTVDRPEYVSPGVRLKWFVRAGNILGTTVLSELVLVNNLNGSFGQGRITAERIK